MKTLSVEQPWAFLIVAGIKDIENRTWQPEQMPCRILIHASKAVDFDTLYNKTPIEWVQEALNHEMFGNIPYLIDLPESAIIGYVTVDYIDSDLFKNRFKENGKNQWADFVSNNENMRYWRLTDAHVFKEPIPCAFEGEEHLWEYADVDEGNLPPAFKVEIAKLQLDGDKIIVPLSEAFWNELEPHSSIDVEITINHARLWFSLLIGQGSDKQSFNTITFTHQGRQRTFQMVPDSVVSDVSDQNGSPMFYPSATDEDGTTRKIAHIVWGEEL